MTKELNRYIRTAPKGTKPKEELTYDYGDGRYFYTNGFSAIIINEEPDFTPKGVNDKGVSKSLAKLDYPASIPTLAEVKAEIKRRGVKRSDKGEQTLYRIADYAKFNIFFIKDILEVLGYCHGYWDKDPYHGLKFVSDKGEALLLCVRAKTP